jgi:hypothetical protein
MSELALRLTRPTSVNSEKAKQRYTSQFGSSLVSTSASLWYHFSGGPLLAMAIGHVRFLFLSHFRTDCSPRMTDDAGGSWFRTNQPSSPSPAQHQNIGVSSITSDKLQLSASQFSLYSGHRYLYGTPITGNNPETLTIHP